MSRFTNFFSKAFDQLRAKKYVGLLSSSLPTDVKNWGPSEFLRANEISLYLNRAIAKRADKVGEIVFLLQDKNGKALPRDPLFDLLYKPNKVFDGPQFWGLWQKYYDLIGETYIYKEKASEFGARGKIIGLHLLRPDLVKKVYSEENPGVVEKYEYNTGNKVTTYQAEDIIYRHNPNPSAPLNGMSLIKAGIMAIQTETQIETYHSRVLENGGKVEGVFKFKTPNLNKEQLQDVKDKYQKEYGSAKKSGMPLFLGGDAEYIKTGMTPAELSFLETKKMTLEDICIMTGVPKEVLGSFADTTYSNADAAIRIFLRETIKPLLTTLTTMLDENLFPDDRFLTFVDPTPENVEEELKKTESGIKNYYMTINEARARHGLDPVKNGDEIKLPFNLVNLGDNPAPKTAKSKGIKGLHPNTDPEVRKLWWEMQIKRMDIRETRFKRLVNKYFAEQRDRIINSLEPTKMRVFRKQGLLEEILNIQVEVKIGKEMFLPILTELLKEAGADAGEFVGSEYNFNLTADMVSYLDTRADIFLNKINETTFGTLKDQFAESLGAGENRDGLITRIRNTYENISEGRAATIARTEVHNATQYGTMEGYKQAGMSIKIWASVHDSHTRETHYLLDGEERPINLPFSNGLMYPGDSNGSAEEVINCRCVI